MYPVDVNNPMYYRSHPYKNQLDLPTSAWKNRQMQQFYSEIPQGKAYFEQTNKKHFSNMFNRSEIEQDKVFKEEYPQQEIQKSRIVMEKSYFRSLNVDDIEGAKPNTLISKAVKNREKALTKIKKEEQSEINRSREPSYAASKQSNSEYNQQKNYHLLMKESKVYKQQEAMNKFSRNKSIMENNSLRVLNNNNDYAPRIESNNYQSQNYKAENNPSSGGQKNYHYRPTKQEYSNQFNDKSQKSTLQNELFEKQQKIKQLERQLGLHNNETLSNAVKYHNNQKQMEESPFNLRYPSAKPVINSSPIHNEQINGSSVPNPYQNQYRNQIDSLNHLSSNQQGLMEQNNRLNFDKNHSLVNYGPKTPIAYVPSTHTQKSKTEDLNGGFQYPVPVSGVPHNRDKSYTQNRDRPDLNIDKRNIRKYNPTFLSFQSDRVKGAI